MPNMNPLLKNWRSVFSFLYLILRGLNENNNRLIIQYFLEETKFNSIGSASLIGDSKTYKLPKILEMKIPNQVFFKNYSIVALPVEFFLYEE